MKLRLHDVSQELSLVTAMAHHWILAFAITVSITATSVALGILATPIYRAKVVLLPTQTRTSMTELGATLGSLGSIGALVGLGGIRSQDTVEAVALLKSRAFAEAFIQDHHLLPRLFPNRWDAKRAAWRTSWRHPSPPSLYDGYRVFDRKVRHVSQNKETELVTLEVDWTNPNQAAQWANEMVERVNDAMRKRALAEANESIALLSNQLDQTRSVELREAIARTIDTYVKSRVLAKVRPDYAFTIIDPAAPTGTDDYIEPNRPLYALSGLCIGLMLAALTCFCYEWITLWAGIRTISAASP